MDFFLGAVSLANLKEMGRELVQVPCSKMSQFGTVSSTVPVPVTDPFLLTVTTISTEVLLESMKDDDRQV